MIIKRRSLKSLMSVLGVTLIAALALSAVGVASASAATQHWYAGGSKLSEGVSTNYVMKGTSSFTLKWKSSGIQFAITCSSQKGEGTIKNPVGGGAGTIIPAKPLTLTGCTVTEPKESGCKVKGGQFNLLATGGGATELEGKSSVNFTTEANIVAEFYFEGCHNEFLNGLVQIFRGSFAGIMNKGTLEFTKTSSAITYGASSVTLEGTSKLETTSGASVTVAP